MKVVTYERYGGPEVLQIIEQPRPTITSTQVLVQVYASSATTADWRVRSLELPLGFGFLGRLIFGMRGPRQKVLGTELSGVVIEVGAAVKRFQMGDQVIVQRGAKMGCYSEYVALDETEVIVIKPKHLCFHEAAVLSFGATTAWAYLNVKTKMKPKDSILVLGASGSVGCAAVQISKYLGARVTAACSAKNRDLLVSLGAMEVIDYNEKNPLSGQTKYDKIVDTVGNASILRALNSLKPGGQLLLVSSNLPQMLLALVLNTFSHKKIVFGPVVQSQEALERVVDLSSLMQMRPVIDRSYSMDRIAFAHGYVQERHKSGNVAITIRAC